MATYLRLDIGASDIDLNDQTNYRLGRGWRPRVARRRGSGLAGWLYEDVTEEIPVQIFSEVSLAACLDARDAIINALDQAHRWRYGEPVNPVLFKCKIDGSGLTNPLQTEVLDGDGDDLLRLEPEFNERVKAWVIETTIGLLRKGDLLSDAESDASSVVGPAEIAACTLASSIPLYSPLSLTLAGMDYSTADAGFYPIAIPQGVLLIASDALRLHRIEAEEYDSTLSSPVTDVIDADASGGAYIRMTSGQSVTYTGLITNGPDGDLIGIYTMCHLTSATDKWQVTTTIFKAGSIGADEDSQTVMIDGLVGYKPVKFGIIGRAAAAYSLTITATRISGAGSLEIDVLGLVGLGGPGERAIQVNAFTFFDPTAASADISMVFNHNRLAARKPSAYTEFVGGVDGASIPYDGDIHLASIGNTVATMWLAGGNQWRHEDDSGVVALTVTASRRRAYLAPR